MNAQDTRVPVTLLTGFLGSGKTTLLNRLLRAPDAGKIAVIVNEFGE
ncbi:MAG: GTP-binding protein, partial [Pseudomonadota bacterium]